MNTSEHKTINNIQQDLLKCIRIGVYAGIICIFVALIGMVEKFNSRDIISEVISMGHTLLVIITLSGTILTIQQFRQISLEYKHSSNGINYLWELLVGIFTGLIISSILAIFVVFINEIDIRPIFINASPTLLTILTFDKDIYTATMNLLVVGVVLGFIGTLFLNLPGKLRLLLIAGISSVIILGMFQDIITIILSKDGWPKILLNFLIDKNGVSVTASIVIFILIVITTSIYPYLPTAYENTMRLVAIYHSINLRISMYIMLAITLLLRIYWFIAISDKNLPMLPLCREGYITTNATLGQCAIVVYNQFNNVTNLFANSTSIINLIITISELILVGSISYSIISILWKSLRKTKSYNTNNLSELEHQTLIIKTKRNFSIVMGSALLLSLPMLLGVFPSEVLVNIGIYMLMGFGLNIVVGNAGLLDLGHVAFFAVGAYTTALLTSPRASLELGLSFWAALPIVIVITGLTGILVATPVLRMRGDYLAIVTLGFGEIARFLFLSDWFKPWLGGAQGIIKIPPISIGSIEFIGPHRIYYLIILFALIALFISVRIKDSRVGRAWMAMKADEKVAETMGINTVYYKLLAFGMGAMIASISGAIFATKLGTIFPHSFNVLVSITALSLIIVGGIGNLTGVIIGALVLVGLPELLREFSEFRLLIYGTLLIVMMLLRPEGLVPKSNANTMIKDQDLTQDAWVDK